MDSLFPIIIESIKENDKKKGPIPIQLELEIPDYYINQQDEKEEPSSEVIQIL